MIDLPENLINESFDENLCQGTVIYYVDLRLEVEIKNKFLVLLNSDCSQYNLHFFLTTSQMKFYITHRKLREYFVFIPENAVTLFPLPTLIDCRYPFPLSRTKLREKYGHQQLVFKGVLPDQFMGKVIKIIRDSKLISPKIKKLILPLQEE